jgi:hypothetical protein
MTCARVAGSFVVGESSPREKGDHTSETRWENEGGKLGLPQGNESVRTQFSLELVKNNDGTEAILYVYRNGGFAKTMTGQYTSVRENARREYVGACMHEIDLAA